MNFIGEMQIEEVETIGICEGDSTIAMVEDSMTEANTIIEMFQISDTTFAQYAVSQDIMNSAVMLQCINSKIWQYFLV